MGEAVSDQPYTVWQLPSILSFSPAQGSVGTVVTIVGDSFCFPIDESTTTCDSGTTTVLLNGIEMPIVSGTLSQIQFEVVAGATSGNITVKTRRLGEVISSQIFTVMP